MSLRISVIAPVLNEVQFIGLSIMSCLDQIHQFVYALDEKSSDGTRDLLHYIKDKNAQEKLIILEHENFHPSDEKKYNATFDRCISESTGEAVFFYHPDMVITNPDSINLMSSGPLAFFTNMTSYAGDFKTIISGRATKWKNIHLNQFALKYRGEYGSQNEDFYHSDITGNAYKHYGVEFSKYPYEIANSGIEINHYCEVKGYKRRLEKMKLCLKTLHPNYDDGRIEELAVCHPRVNLEKYDKRFGTFDFVPSEKEIPEVFKKYEAEFSAFKKQGEIVYG